MRSPPLFVAVVCLACLGASGSFAASPAADTPVAATATADGADAQDTLGHAPDETNPAPPDPNENPLPLDAAEQTQDNAGTHADSADPHLAPLSKSAGDELVAKGEPAATKPAVDVKKAPPGPTRKSRDNKPLFNVGLNVTTSSTSPLPIPLGVEGKLAAFVELRLLDVDLTDDLALFVRGKAAGAYAQGTSHFRASYVPFSDKGGIAIVGERYQFGPDLSLGMRWSHIEAAVDVGVRGGNEVGIARYIGARASVGVRYVLDMGVGFGVVYELQHAMSLGDVAPGWTSSTSGFGLRLSYGI